MSIALALIAAFAAGCQSPSQGYARDGNSAREAEPRHIRDLLDMPPRRAAAVYAEPQRQRELRERALALLTELVEDPDPQTRANAVEALAGIESGPASADPGAHGRLRALIGPRLEDENLGVRSVAAIAVGRCGFDEHAGALQTLLDDSSPYVRSSAIFALKEFGREVDPTPLATFLLTDPSPRVRAHAAMILGELGEPSAMGMLRQAVQDEPPRADPSEMRILQLQIAEAMVKLGDEKQIETIRAALYPSRPQELEAVPLAVQILGHLDDRRSIDQLVYLAEYRNEQGQLMPAEVRLAAAGSLARLGLTTGSFVAEEFKRNESGPIRLQAAYVYGQIGRLENLPRLEAMLDDPIGPVRVAAAGGILSILGP